MKILSLKILEKELSCCSLPYCVTKMNTETYVGASIRFCEFIRILPSKIECTSLKAFVFRCLSLPLLCFVVVSYNQEELKEMQRSNKEPDVV